MLSWDSQELLGGSMWLRGESVLCECLAYGLWDHNKAVLNRVRGCEASPAG